MTIPIDSLTPSSHPLRTIIATVLTITTATHIIASKERTIFPVATSRMANANPTAAIIPLVAYLTIALSDSIQHQNTPAVCLPDLKVEPGALAMKSSMYFYHLS